MERLATTTTIQILKRQNPEFLKAGKLPKCRMYSFDIEKGVIVNSPVLGKGEIHERTYSKSICERIYKELMDTGFAGEETNVSKLKKYIKECPEIGKKAEQHTYRIIKIRI